MNLADKLEEMLDSDLADRLANASEEEKNHIAAETGRLKAAIEVVLMAFELAPLPAQVAKITLEPLRMTALTMVLAAHALKFATREIEGQEVILLDGARFVSNLLCERLEENIRAMLRDAADKGAKIGVEVEVRERGNGKKEEAPTT